MNSYCKYRCVVTIRDKHKATHPPLCEPPPGAPQHPRARPRPVPCPRHLRLSYGGAAERDPVLLHPRHQVRWLARTLLILKLMSSRKVLRLSLERCDLRSVNFVILATAIGCVQRANLSEVKSLDNHIHSDYHILSADCPRS